MSQGWAGGQYGTMSIPRVGHEVIVSFLEGDPDRPIITGRVYHELNQPPYTLPDNKTRTVFKSYSSPSKDKRSIPNSGEMTKPMTPMEEAEEPTQKAKNASSPSMGTAATKVTTPVIGQNIPAWSNDPGLGLWRHPHQ